MKTLIAFLTAAVIAIGLGTVSTASSAGTVYLPCHPNCGPVCVPGGTMKCK